MTQTEISKQLVRLPEDSIDLPQNREVDERLAIHDRLTELDLPPEKLADYLSMYLRYSLSKPNASTTSELYCDSLQAWSFATANKSSPHEKALLPIHLRWQQMDVEQYVLYCDDSSENEDVTSRPPIEAARDAVRRDILKLKKGFGVLESRLGPSSALKTSLRFLEDEAARYTYEMLSRVAAILHDALKHNPIEDFSEEQFQGFLEATKRATEGRADQADPYLCELAMFRVGISWLPTLPDTNVVYDDDDVEA